MAIRKPLEQITEVDLENLLGETESQTMEFKRDVLVKHSPNSDPILEFLKDVSSFANAEGGDLIVGIEEQDGKATKLVPISHQDIESLETKITNYCLTYVSPPLVGVRFKAIELKTGGHALLVRIPQSWSAPHQVTYQQEHRFYSRRERDCLKMTTEELKRAFGLAESGISKLKEFREKRLAIAVDFLPSQGAISRALLVTHAIPLSSLLRPSEFDLVALANEGKKISLYPHAYESVFNFDGLMVNGLMRNLERAQIFRNGCVEFAEAIGQSDGARTFIDANELSRRIALRTKYALGIQSQMGITLPVYLGISLINVAGHQLRAFKGHDGLCLDRGQLKISELLVDRFEPDLPKLLMPALNIVAQSFGNKTWGNWGD